MKDQELVNAIRRLKVETGSLSCMGCEHERNCGVSGCAVMREAADRIANQSTHILALQKEIAGLRKAVRWVHDGLYLCDPEKNTVCKKSGCKKQCFHTTFPAFADAWAETPAPQLRWIPVEERLPELQNWGASKVVLGIVQNESGYPPPNPCFCVYLGNQKWRIRGRMATITHWMPLPEPPEEER